MMMTLPGHVILIPIIRNKMPTKPEDIAAAVMRALDRACARDLP